MMIFIVQYELFSICERRSHTHIINYYHQSFVWAVVLLFRNSRMHTLGCVVPKGKRTQGKMKAKEKRTRRGDGKIFSPVYDIIHALNSRNDHKTNDYYRFACDSRALVIS